MNNAIDKNSREYLQAKVKNGRHSLLLVIIFTVVNLVGLVTGSNTYFLFSAAVPYYMTAFGMGMDMGLGAEGISTFTITALALSVVILAVYFVCWLLAKKKIGWYIVATVLFAADILILLGICLSMDALTESIMDVVFHAWVIAELVQSINCHKKLQKLPPETVEGQVLQTAPAAAAEPVEPWERKDIE